MFGETTKNINVLIIYHEDVKAHVCKNGGSSKMINEKKLWIKHYTALEFVLFIFIYLFTVFSSILSHILLVCHSTFMKYFEKNMTQH